ncbi:hypothetical protein B0J14DRAFT_546884 [Halenospora varia]|nr:hypothetical protein B0J14DRAFT_546884 [Halenospora varia]
MYGFSGFSIFVPAIYDVMLHNWMLQNERISLAYVMELGVLKGTAIDTLRIPERWYPRRFDSYGASNQIMHVLVICGALLHTVGLVKAFD